MEPAPGNQYDRIDPPCVYDGLGRTVAWALAIQMGYSRGEANDLLGFSFDASKNNPAMVSLPNVTILTYSNWIVAQIGLYSTPKNLEFTEWSITPDGEPAVTFSIQGCFRTASVVGNQAKDWGDGYPVICVVAEDTQAGYHVNSLGGHLYTGGDQGSTAYFLSLGTRVRAGGSGLETRRVLMLISLALARPHFKRGTKIIPRRTKRRPGAASG